MYAIVRTGGKQYRVERGQRLLVERLPDEAGADVALEPILYRSEQAVFDPDGLASVKVTARVLGHERGEKLRVFKFKPKRGYKRRTGHRQELTRIEVTDISVGSAGAGEKPAAAKRTSTKAAAAKQAEPREQGAKGADAKAAAAKGAEKKAAKPAAAKRPAAKPAAAAKAKEEPSDGS
jgi:large subunit ribosomal protein L21